LQSLYGGYARRTGSGRGQENCAMRKVLGITSAPRLHWVGDGFPVRPMLSPDLHGKDLSPFLLLDYAAPMTFAPTTARRGVGQHPHRGFETVTIVYDGELEHRDSTGAGGIIGAGDVQWMTAAAGILHEEFHAKSFAEKGGTLEMAQLWVNLPARHKSASPGYQTILAKDIPAVALPNGAGTLRVIAGSFAGASGPARTFTPIDLWDVRLNPGKKAAFMPPAGHTLGLAVLSGSLTINGTEKVQSPGLAVFSIEGGGVTVHAHGDTKLLVLSGEPIHEPIVARGPFVMTTEGEIKQAMLDYKNGRFGEIGG
jgi:redox-sensitive bicupin YhaK (pirin superfamily)